MNCYCVERYTVLSPLNLLLLSKRKVTALFEMQTHPEGSLLTQNSVLLNKARLVLLASRLTGPEVDLSCLI